MKMDGTSKKVGNSLGVLGSDFIVVTPEYHEHLMKYFRASQKLKRMRCFRDRCESATRGLSGLLLRLTGRHAGVKEMISRADKRVEDLHGDIYRIELMAPYSIGTRGYCGPPILNNQN